MSFGFTEVYVYSTSTPRELVISSQATEACSRYAIDAPPLTVNDCLKVTLQSKILLECECITHRNKYHNSAGNACCSVFFGEHA
ncbi:hypothetical protein PENCOP_c006G01614 [Penicillium coprophilum]|uniref:Uncharacterized protein n=1 Tax=Penicillium coprophilum TaxID=36646 RepID=A0A1V6UNK4_9EURO|nr:hypothetical protein PENCOP_c006G01614 [Penicillium coprophilum]